MTDTVSSPPDRTHRSRAELDALLDHVRDAPSDVGTVALVVRRPAIDAREVVAVGELDPAVGLVGDTWTERGSSRTPDGSPHPEMQLTLMNVRAAAAVAVDPDRWQLAGDQVYVDFDLAVDRLPAGTLLHLGTAIVEITAQPHTGCAKFSERFGPDALRWVNSDDGRSLRLRGVNCRVVSGGFVRPGDEVRRSAD